MSLTLTRSRLRAAATVAVLAVVVPAVGAGAGGGVQPVTCRNPAPLLEKGGGVWQSMRAPTFAPGIGVGSVSQDVTAYAVDPTDPFTLAVTNGNSIYVSHDGGCAFALGLRLDEVPSDPQHVPLSGDATKIVSLYIAPRSHRIYATAEELDTGATVGRPHILTSADGQIGSWTLGDSGLPPLGHPLRLRAAPTAPSVMYVSFAGAREDSTTVTCPPAPLPCPGGSSGGQRLGLLWGSTDGGKTWTSRTDPGDLNGAAEIKYFSIEDDDASGRTLWVVANGLLRKSTNGGASYQVPDGLSQAGFNFTAVESIDKSKDVPNNPLKLVAFADNGEMIRLQGGRWIRSHVPFPPVESVSQRPDGDIAVATTPKGGSIEVWRIFFKDFHDFELKEGLAGRTFRATYGWESITPGAYLTVAGQITSGDHGAGPGTFFVKDKKRILRFLKSTVREGLSLADPITVGAPPPPRGRISPPVVTLDLPMGRSKTVNYTLTLPPAPTPIDMFLLIDNSDSMLALIEDLKRNLGDVIRALYATGVDVNVGVGEVNVQPSGDVFSDPRSAVPNTNPKPLYKLMRRIGPVNSDLFRGLSLVAGDAGPGDEAQLESLWQSVVGDGLSFANLGSLVGYSIPPGQQAGFRTNLTSIRVIVHATDEKFSTNIKDAHNSPTEVAAQLRNAGVKQIGLSQGSTESRPDLAQMAKLTGAVAPRGGTDCDGDGYVDIQAGDALVCDQNYGLDVTLLNLIKSLSDRQVISLMATSTPTLKSVSRTSFAIDAKQATRVTFKATYSCAGGTVPGQYVNTLNASLRGAIVASAVATVNCGGVTVPVPPRVAAEPLNPPVPPQPQPLLPVVPVNPLPVPQTQVQPQVNPQAGMAEQQQKQVQLASAHNDVTDEVEELAMSRLQQPPRPSPGMVLTAGLGLACAAGVALRRRTRTAHAQAQARARR